MLAEEARAVDRARAALQDRAQQARVVARVVFEVGVLDQQDVAAGGRQAGADGGALAAVARVADHEGVGPVALPAEGRGGAVGRAVVDDDDLARDRRAEIDRAHPRQQFGDRPGLVVDRHDHREQAAPAGRVSRVTHAGSRPIPAKGGRRSRTAASSAATAARAPSWTAGA